MRNHIVYLVLLITSSLASNAMEQDQPKELRAFGEYELICTMLSNDCESIWEISPAEQLDIWRAFERKKSSWPWFLTSYLVDSFQTKHVKQIFWGFTEAKKSVVENNLVESVPYASRQRHFPDHKPEFRTLVPIENFESCVLAVGGTREETLLLKMKGLQEDICSINVCPQAKPNYLADFSNDSHMKSFENKFNLAYGHAIPLGSQEPSFKNIARCLSDEGIFAGYFFPNSEISLERLLNEAGFKWFIIVDHGDTTGKFRFVASVKALEHVSLEDFRTTLTDSAQLILDYVLWTNERK